MKRRTWLCAHVLADGVHGRHTDVARFRARLQGNTITSDHLELA
jgi:hypothetical protein